MINSLKPVSNSIEKISLPEMKNKCQYCGKKFPYFRIEPGPCYTQDRREGRARGKILSVPVPDAINVRAALNL